MALIITEPKDVNLRQLEMELGCSGINVCINPDGTMLVEAGCPKRKLEDALAAHEPDVDFAHPDDIRKAAEAQAAEQERAVRVADLEAKLIRFDITLDELREALGR